MMRDGSAVRDAAASLLRVLLRVLLLHELLGVGVFALGAGVHQTARALFLGISLGLALNLWSEASEANARDAMAEAAPAAPAAPERAPTPPPWSFVPGSDEEPPDHEGFKPVFGPARRHGALRARRQRPARRRARAPPEAPDPWRRFFVRLRRQALAQRAVAQIAANFENESDGEEEPGEEDAEYAALFAQQAQLSIVAFNIRKLQANIEGTAPMFQALMKEMSEHDVIMLTEVPASDKAYRERVLWFLSVLNTLSGAAEKPVWTLAVSEPSNAVSLTEERVKSDKPVSPRSGGNKEIHVCFAKAPVVIKRNWTWKTITSSGSGLDWAPLTVALDVSHVKSMPEKTMLLTMLHMPPASRERQRDVQLKAVIAGYAERARLEYGYPMTIKGAKDARKERAVHVLAGDFNVHPGVTEDGTEDGKETYGLKAGGWAPALFGPLTATSSGGKAYDNILVDAESWTILEKDAHEGKCELQRNVHNLAFPTKRGVKGISDHVPVSLTIRDRVLVEEAGTPAAGAYTRRGE